jgi:superfamily I DNA/RNA helicase
VANLLPVDASGIWGGTFHAVGNRILRRHGSTLGYSSGFTMMDREDQKDLINAVAVRFTNYLSQRGPEHEKTFVVQAVWEGIVLAQGKGRSKKQAEIEAMQLKRSEKKL